MILSCISVHFKRKTFFCFGLFIGILFSLNYNPYDLINCSNNENFNQVFENNNEISKEIPVPQVKKLVAPVKNVAKSLNRPRYYSTELGIRDKVFVAILTTVDKLDNYALAINKTLGYSVNKLKYFVQADHNAKLDPSVGNVVGFTDNREIHKPFHVLKYISDNFLQDFDFFYLMLDKTYVNGRKLKQIINKISISEDIYMGEKLPDSSYCSLNGGILLSNSVIEKIKFNLGWCVANTISIDHNENIGRCIVHSANIECHDNIQAQNYFTFKSQFFSVSKHLNDLIAKPKFLNAIAVYPILDVQDMYILHNYYSKNTLSDIRNQIKILKQSILDTNNLLPENLQSLSWPVGDKEFSKPLTRFDVQRYDLFNETHIFAKDDFSILNEMDYLTKVDLQDILKSTLEYVRKRYNVQLDFIKMLHGYRHFDAARGLSYVLDLKFQDKNFNEIIKRFEICKTLGQAEILQIPYVTENTRVAIIVPVYEDETKLAIEFLKSYGENIMTRREKTLLMLTFLYGNETKSKGKEDIFFETKQFAQKLTEKYKNINSKIVWVSIKFPKATVIKNQKMINFPIIDLSLKKIGSEALIFYADVHIELKYEFLNRVRMNTIIEYQVFIPIPFVQYNPIISEHIDLDISKNSGRFDNFNYRYISFYAKDYIQIRKKTEKIIPIIRQDKDIDEILLRPYSNINNLADYFLKYNHDLHYFHAIEPGLRVKYYDYCTTGHTSVVLNSKSQFGKLINDYIVISKTKKM